jgi:hypothetical protein
MSLLKQALSPKPSKLIKILIISDFALFALLISPLGTSRALYKAMKTSGLAGPISTAEQIWVVATTLLSTALFFWRKFKSDGVTRIDGILILTWWIVLAFACMYAFMMGMGG